MISHNEILRIAQLCNLDLSEAEVEKFTRELSNILDFFQQLQEVNTDQVHPTAQITGLQNVKREDFVQNCDVSEALLKSSANGIENHQIVVNQVL